jgi:pilus assembly protein CpaD
MLASESRSGRAASRAARHFAIGLVAALSAPLGACGTDYASSDPAFPGDFAARHPIVVASVPTSLDVYPTGGRLDARTVADLGAFAARYRRLGSGEIAILTPWRQAPGAKVVGDIRRALAQAGAGAPIRVGSYAPLRPENPAPVRVAFLGLAAEVKTPCGLWPEDLASGSSLEGWKNEPYANFGCATQSVIAAQVDDPRDFVQSRALAPSDVAMRTRAIEDVRKGQDPGVTWTTGLTPIGAGN